MQKLKLSITICLLLASRLSFFAQDLPRDKMDRLNTQKVAFFTERLRLTPQEAQLFWPLYNEYQEKKNKIITERRELTRNLVQNQKSLSDGEVEDIGDIYIQSVIREAQLLEVYHEKFKDVLPVRKVMRIYQTETQFKDYLLRQIRQNRQRQNPNRF